jgi:outer membrane lipoprotein-sorting protein
MVSFCSHLAAARRPLTLAVPLVVGLALLVASSARSLAADTNSIIAGWLDSQTNLTTWSADVIQTRTLSSLVHPLTATGQVWFASPNLFRWELGSPPRTIAVRQPDRMLIIYPRLNRVELFPLDNHATGPWRDALALIEAGFPRSAAELADRFRLLSVESSSNSHQITLQPVTPSARRLMPRISVFLTPDPLMLQATEIEFADGSLMRNEFTNAVHNPVIDPALFDPPLDPDWKIIPAGP